eukprot:scaffold55522_cov42-Attheya_sp.AAC.1
MTKIMTTRTISILILFCWTDREDTFYCRKEFKIRNLAVHPSPVVVSRWNAMSAEKRIFRFSAAPSALRSC